MPVGFGTVLNNIKLGATDANRVASQLKHYRDHAFVLRHLRSHRIPRSTFGTIAIRPSDKAGRLESVMLRLANGEAKYFLSKGWTMTRRGTEWFGRSGSL
jgi:hypothetical protein